MQPIIQRLAALLVFAAPMVVVGLGDATWGAARVRSGPAREAHPLVVEPAPTVSHADERAESAVVLVVLDGVRWQDVFGGADRALSRRARRQDGSDDWADPRELTPNLHRMIDTTGLAVGAPGHSEITATGPQFISLPGYIEILTGKPDPTCLWNECAPAPTRTLMDQIRDASGRADVALVASWPNIARAATAGPPDFALSGGRHLVAGEDLLRDDAETAHLLDAAARVKAFPGDGDYRPDVWTARVALRHLAVAQPRFLFVGLGDADEYAHRGDYLHYLEAVHAEDAFLGELVATLATLGARGRHTSILVTADHGRASNFNDHGPRYPESGRVWLVASGSDVRARGFAPAHSGSPRRHTLSEVAPTVRALLGIADGGGPALGEIVGTRAASAEPLSSRAVEVAAD